MKNRYLNIMGLFFLLLACSQKYKDKYLPIKDVNIIDVEENDTKSQANETGTQNQIVGFFNNKDNIGDKDYYKIFFSLKNTSYEIVLTAVPGIDAKVSFFAPDGKRLFVIDEKGRGESEKMWNYNPVHDYLFMLVESKIGYNERVPYIINFILKDKEGINELEPNDDRENAMELEVGQLKKGLISPKNDFDFYKIVFKDDIIEDYSVKIETLSNLDINFTVYNDEADIIKFINSYSWGQQEVYPFLSSDKGEYFIKVSGNINKFDQKDPIYYISLDENSSQDSSSENYFEREFNDNDKLATELLNNSTMTGTFYPQNDQDWYQFDIIRNPISVSVSLLRIKGLNPKIELYNNHLSKIQVIDNNQIDEGENAVFNDLKKGRYYLKLSSENKSLLIYRLFLNIRYK